MQRFFFVLYLVFLSISFAHAAVIITFSESGDDVVATSSGSLITTGLINPSQLSGTGGYLAGTGASQFAACAILVGTDPTEADTFGFDSWKNNNEDVCVTGAWTPASSGSGNFVGGQ